MKYKNIKLSNIDFFSEIGVIKVYLHFQTAINPKN